MHNRHHPVSKRRGFNLKKNLALVQNVKNKMSGGGRGIEFTKVKLLKYYQNIPDYHKYKKLLEL